jgi:hypothetical protein
MKLTLAFLAGSLLTYLLPHVTRWLLSFVLEIHPDHDQYDGEGLFV